MNTELHVRGLPEATKLTLEKIARNKGISTNELVKTILNDFVKAPELRNLDNKYTELTDKMIALYKVQADRLAETLAEQSELIRELLDRQDV